MLFFSLSLLIFFLNRARVVCMHPLHAASEHTLCKQMRSFSLREEKKSVIFISHEWRRDQNTPFNYLTCRWQRIGRIAMLEGLCFVRVMQQCIWPTMEFEQVGKNKYCEYWICTRTHKLAKWALNSTLRLSDEWVFFFIKNTRKKPNLAQK